MQNAYAWHSGGLPPLPTAVGDNNIGVSGVNWNNIHLLSCKFINSQARHGTGLEMCTFVAGGGVTSGPERSG